MSGGAISGNSASGYGGGGVYVNTGSSWPVSIAKTGGTIYGYTPDDPYSNKVENSSGVIQSNKGHAVYGDATYRKETTLGEDDDLFYNYPESGQHSGW
jgi:hypothetical protein